MLMSEINFTCRCLYDNIKSVLCLLLLVIASSCTPPGEQTREKDERIANEMRNAAKSMMEGDNATALEIYRHVARENPDQLSLKSKDALVRCYSNMGYILFFCNQDYIKSFEALITGKEIAETLPNCESVPELYLNLANVFAVYGDRRLAQKYFAMAYDEALYRQNWDVLLTTAYNLLNYEMAGTLDREGQLRLDRFQNLKVPVHPMLPLVSGLCQVYTLRRQGRNQEAIRLLQQVREMPTNSLTPKRISTLCDIYSLRIALNGNMDKEGMLFANRLELLADSSDTDMRDNIYEWLAYFYSNCGDSEKALHNYRLGKALSDSLFAVSKYSVLHDMQLENKQKQHSLELFAEKEKEQKWFTWFLVMLAYVIMLIGAVIVIALQNRRLKARNKELYLRHVEMQKLEDELVELRKTTEMPAIIAAEQFEKADPIPPDEVEQQLTDANLPEEKSETDNTNTTETKEEGEGRQIANHLSILAEKIVGVMNDENEVTQQDFSLEKLTRLTNSNRNYVSQVINTLYKKNFNSVVSEVRIKIACRHLTTPGPYRNMTVEALAETVGFKSRSNFVVVFKKITGLSPSDYRRSVDN